jgi:antitoxin ParD1/3/4
MDTMNISLPDSLKEFVEVQVSEGGYNDASEYVGELISADQKQKAWAVLEAEVLKGIRSGKSKPMTEDDWSRLRDRVGRHAEKK